MLESEHEMAIMKPFQPLLTGLMQLECLGWEKKQKNYNSMQIYFIGKQRWVLTTQSVSPLCQDHEHTEHGHTSWL